MKNKIFAILILIHIVSSNVIQVEPKHVKKFEKVKISWNIQSTKNSWIGVYPATRIIDKWPIIKINITTNIGSTDISIFNLRHDYEIRLFTSNVIIKEKITVTPNEPLQGRLSITRNPSQMRVMWSTNDSMVPFVFYKKVNEQDFKFQRGTSETYTKRDMCHDPATEDYHPKDGTAFWYPGFIHNVLLTELELDTEYIYYFGNPQYGFSEKLKFKTAPKIGSKRILNFIAFGDLGSVPLGYHPYRSPPGAVATYKSLIKDVSSNPYDLILHIGDIAYAYGCGLGWEFFGHNIEPIASKVPWLVSVGNHEYQYRNSPFRTNWTNYYGDDSGGECNVPFMKRFDMPRGPKDEKNIWYSFDYGQVHFIFLSFEHDFTKNSIQYNWLRYDFQNINRERTPFIIVSSHRPMYCTGNYTGDYIMTINIQRELDDLFAEFKPHIFFSGHYHSYERTCPMSHYKCQEKGTMHIMTGSAGYGLDSAPWRVPKPDWSIIRVQTYGYTRIKIVDNVLYGEYLETTTEKILDQFKITL